MTGAPLPTAAGTASRVRAALTVYVLVAALGARRGGPVLCPFRRLTGHPCPVCGLSRSVASTARGDLRRAAGEHVLGAPLVVSVLLSYWSLARGTPRRTT